MDSNEETWDFLHPWLCPGVTDLTADPAPSLAVGPGITASATLFTLVFTGEANGVDSAALETNEQNKVYGYKVSW